MDCLKVFILFYFEMVGNDVETFDAGRFALFQKELTCWKGVKSMARIISCAFVLHNWFVDLHDDCWKDIESWKDTDSDDDNDVERHDEAPACAVSKRDKIAHYVFVNKLHLY